MSIHSTLVRKTLALVLVTTMLVSLLPMAALADMNLTRHNTPEQNQTILAALRELYGDEIAAQFALEEMERLGLLDGEEWVTSTIDIDGEQLTLAQVRELVYSDIVDLSKVVRVSGTPIALRDLKIMIEIEDEIQRIKDTYFGDITLNEAQQQALASLREQINNQGITMTTQGDEPELVFPSGIDHFIYAKVPGYWVMPNGGGDSSYSLTLYDSKDEWGYSVFQPLDYPISISYRFVDGSAKNGENYVGTDGTITFFKDGCTSAEKHIPFTILDDETHWDGHKSFLIQFYNPVNVVLNEGGQQAAETLVIISSNYTWETLDGSLLSTNELGNTLPFKVWKGLPAHRTFSYSDITWGLVDTLELKMTLYDPWIQWIDAWIGDEPPDDPVGIAISIEVDDWAHYEFPLSLYPGPHPDTVEYVGRIDFEDGMQVVVDRSISILLNPVYEWVGDVELEGHVNVADMTLSLRDTIRPQVVGVTLPELPVGMFFEYGQSVPIVVEYSEPVNLSEATILINNTDELRAVESGSLGTRFATFLYPVKSPDGDSLVANSPLGAKDLHENAQYAHLESYSASNIIKGIQKAHAFGEATASVALHENAQGMAGQVSIELISLPDWLLNEALEDDLRIPSIYASIDGGITPIDLMANDADDPTALVGDFTDVLNVTDTVVTRVVEFYLASEVGSSENHMLMIGTYATYPVQPIVFLEQGDFYITYHDFPADGIIYADQDIVPQLGIGLVSGINATWVDPIDDFIWASSDDSVATISPDGTIMLTGTTGIVTFTLTATNGGIDGMAVSKESNALEVRESEPFLTIPTRHSIISIRQGEEAEVYWASNLIAKNADMGQGTQFALEMFAADYTSGVPQKGAALHSTTMYASLENPVSSHVIPASFLTQLSNIPQHSYMVEVSSLDLVNNEMLTATAYITVFSRPAVVNLAQLATYNITDNTTSIIINWTLEYFDTTNNAEFALQIMKDGIPVYHQTSTANQGGSYQFIIPAVVGGFKDIYTVTVKAKNHMDPTWSYDSFVLNVYRAISLKLWIDGKVAGHEHFMSNVLEISGMSGADILDLQRNIHVKNMISINYDDHAWGQISDQIRWQSTDSRVASINYRQGSLYEDIEGFVYTSYRPATEFVLSGIQDGTTQVTAIHMATNMMQTVDVHVETLKDKLYLFQVYPQAMTSLTYTNGFGEQRRMVTNEEGALALYEESGIASNIYMQSTFNDRQYRGTLYNERLVSSEKDSTKLELYPQNNFRLREVATVELYLKKPDGTPYEGEVILRGGVYKNGEYCPEAELNDQSGEADQTLTVASNGKFTVKMDATKFWTVSNDEALLPQDRIQFIYEVRFPGDTYYPQLLTIDGNINIHESVRFGLSTVNLKDVSLVNKQKPFVALQYTESNTNMPNNDLSTFAGKIGPGQDNETLRALTKVLWWGETSLDEQGLNQLFFEDQFGLIPGGQAHEIIIYPFSSIKTSTHTFTLDEDMMQDWLAVYEDRGINLVMIDEGGGQYRKIPMPFRIINMLGAERVEESENLQFLLQTIGSSSAADASQMSLSDRLIGAGLQYLSKRDMGGDMFSMIVAPTDDPSVFRALIKAGIGDMLYDADQSTSDLSLVPGIKDASKMYQGTYLVDQRQSNAKAQDTGKNSASSIHYTFGGLMEAEISYNTTKQEWEILLLHGGFNAGGGMSYTWNFNAWVGPVPVTAQLKVGGTLEVIFKVAIQRGEEITITYDQSSVNDYLTTLRVFAYFRAFAGLGIDHSVIALKIGIFGQISLDAHFAFLNQPYITSTAQVGYKLGASGVVGIEFFAKFLFVSYKYILSTDFEIVEKTFGKWDDIHAIWEEIGKGSSGTQRVSLAQPLLMSHGAVMYPVAQQAIVEERGYLEQFERSWVTPGFGIMALDPENKVATLETNSYPYSNPVLTDDGHILVYITDAGSSGVEDTEVRWTQLDGDHYPNGVPIEFNGSGFGDSQLKLAGTKDFAAAVWVRQSESLQKEAGDPITNADVALMANSTEIMVAIYDGIEWQTTQLTDNISPDLAPVVATNGNKVMVAWRSVYAAEASDPLNFSGVDRILYAIFSNGVWSEPETMYNGTSGAVKGLDGGMLADGTAAVVYCIDTVGAEFAVSDDEDMQSGLEIVYALVNTDGEIATNVRLTNDHYLDQNPQITTVHFADGSEWFVLGWHSVHDVDGMGVNDIRLRALNSVGTLHADFIDSISSVNAAGDIHITPNFRFVKNANTIDDLSILWVESADTGTIDESSNVADKDLLKAVKFRSQNDRIYITAALHVAEMPDYTLVDHFDAYTSGDDIIKAVILGTSYDNGFEATGLAVMENGELVDLVLPVRQSHLYTATATYENKIELGLVAVDYESVIRGMRIPVQFRLHNGGIQSITSVRIAVGADEVVCDDLNFLPNDSILFTAYYQIPADRVINPEYQITATFGREASGEMMLVATSDVDTVTGTLHIDIPDVGISRLDSLREENGERLMQIMLYNYSDAQLAGSNRIVKLGFFSDVDYSVEVMPTQTIEAEAELHLIDVGAYAKQVTFDIKQYVGEGNEIPLGGVRLYARAWIEEPLPDEPGKTGEIMEYYLGNNVKTIVFESLILRNDGHLATISTEQVNEGGATQAIVTVKNNSLVQTSSGNLIVRLLDNNGDVLETLQSYDVGAANQGLIQLGSEETTTQEFNFIQQGTSVTVTYSNAVLTDDTNTHLASLTLSGIPFKYETGVYTYIVNVNDMTSTVVSVVAEDPNATISINNTGMNSTSVPLAQGSNVISVRVTAADGITTQTYQVTVNNGQPAPDPDPDPSPQPPVWEPIIIHNIGGTVTVSSNYRQATITPDEGYRVKDVQVNGVPLGAVTEYSVPANQVIYLVEVVFEKAIGRISVIHNQGGVVAVSVDELSVTITPDEGNRILDVLVNGASVGAVSQYYFADATMDYEVEVIFEKVAAVPGVVTIVHNSGGIVTLSDDGLCVTIACDKGYIVGDVLVNGISVGALTRYCMQPGADYVIEVVFVESTKVLAHLTDVAITHWARDVIAFVVARRLLVGTSATQFSPDLPITRAMLVSVLARVDGGVAQAPARFSDVHPDAWYAKTVAWAVENSIISGDAEGRFAPNRPITREELTVIVTKYFQYVGIELPVSKVKPYADSSSISDWAWDSVLAIQQAGIMVGKSDNMFDPQGSLTRAEFSAVLQRIITRFLE